MKEVTVGFAICGSFCTHAEAIEQVETLKSLGYNIIPIMSPAAYETDTRFGTAEDFKNKIELICGNEIIHTIKDAEPIGPKKLFDILIIAPCTGNTLAKMANGITDTSVTMAAKAHLRNNRPLLLAIATNDALSGSAKNIGHLLNVKNIYFVPMKQDDPIKKATSVIADFSKIPDAIKSALDGEQMQPVLL